MIKPTIKDIAALVGKNSRCICATDFVEFPCWKCHQKAFEFFWFARWDEPTLMEYPMGFDTWWCDVLTPGDDYAPGKSMRLILGVPHKASYCYSTAVWEGSGQSEYLAGADLEPLLIEHRLHVEEKDQL
jgi:hypothetical protein